jgi:hypothetical protein
LGETGLCGSNQIGLRIIKSKPPEFQEAFFMKKGFNRKVRKGFTKKNKSEFKVQAQKREVGLVTFFNFGLIFSQSLF